MPSNSSDLQWYQPSSRPKTVQVRMVPKSEDEINTIVDKFDKDIVGIVEGVGESWGKIRVALEGRKK
jgi:hypothetical protein